MTSTIAISISVNPCCLVRTFFLLIGKNSNGTSVPNVANFMPGCQVNPIGALNSILETCKSTSCAVMTR